MILPFDAGGDVPFVDPGRLIYPVFPRHSSVLHVQAKDVTLVEYLFRFSAELRTGAQEARCFAIPRVDDDWCVFEQT